MVKFISKVVAIVGASILCMSVSSCENEADIREGIAAIVGWLIPELAEPLNYLTLMGKKGEIAKQNHVLYITQNQVDAVLAKIAEAKKAKDITILGFYIDQEIPTLRPILNEYGMGKLKRFLLQLDPRLPQMLETTSPRILALMQTQKVISTDSWLSVASIEGGPTLTDSQMDAITEMLVEQWDASAPTRSTPEI